MTARKKSSASYSISKVREADEANQYYVTIERDGKDVGDVKVRSTSSADGYYNDSDAGERTRSKK